MQRRKFLATLAAFSGGALSSSTLLALEKTGPFLPAGTGGRKPASLQALVDTIIPRTDTPGATDVGVADFVLQFAARFMEPNEREQFLQGLHSFDEDNPGFSENFVDERESIVRELLRADAGSVAESLLKLRELVIIGYYNSEAGASLELAYDPVPGPFRQVSIEEYDRTWAS